MRVRFAWVLTLVWVILGVAAAAPGNAREQPVRVFLRGDQVVFPDQQPVIVDGRTLVPIRGVFEEMGAQVKWESDARRVTVSWRGNQAAGKLTGTKDIEP